MTDNEIVKALEEWRKEIITDYQRLKLLDAPMDCFEESHADTVTKLSNALDLINRQKAEIERLQKSIEKTDSAYFKKSAEVDNLTYDLDLLKQEKSVVKAEAYKVCIEKAKDELEEWVGADKCISYSRIEKVLDNVLKGMIGE